MNKNFLFVMRKAPYGSSLAREGLDALLTCAAFEQNITVVFMNDGVLQLINEQEAEKIGQKNQQKMLSVLELYDVSEIFVHSDSLEKRGLTEADLSLPVKILNADEIGRLFNNQDIILQF